ncbi:hypothetical protein ADL22_13685 [Streptomyces sp. NRRL F-4489]|uniref:hypothetical protein n=1 Tax=Streptomyces sp. NRRL F-4489 TaxID=1609095 RepID=UPI0007470C2C|nr:hypothetical protein [Streptomyces sp. NRRL F-4489]KUL43123.1 hypothetical protein ADL22_13685 [Streptomyces sp. NRRL F-4489]
MSTAFRRPSALPASRGRSALPWWALALPAVSFIALLVLLAHPAQAGAAGAAHSPEGLRPVLEFLAGVIPSGR